MKDVFTKENTKGHAFDGKSYLLRKSYAFDENTSFIKKIDI